MKTQQIPEWIPVTNFEARILALWLRPEVTELAHKRWTGILPDVTSLRKPRSVKKFVVQFVRAIDPNLSLSAKEKAILQS
jgi:hypothetical protein